MTLINFLRGVTQIIKDKDWSAYQSLLILNQSILSFFSISMLANGYSEREILSSFTIYYALIILSLFYISKTPNNREIKINFVFILVQVGLIASIFYENLYVLLAPALMTGFSVLKDTYSVNAISNFNTIAFRTANTEKDIVSISTLLGMISPILFMPLFGALNDYGLRYVIITYSFVLLVLFAYKVKVKNKESDEDIVSEKVKAPMQIHLICALSTAANMVSFVLRYFVMPIIALVVASDLGLGDDAIKLFGFFLGMMAIVSILCPRKSESDSCSMMIKGYMAVMFSAMGLTALIALYDTINSPVFVSALAILAFSVFEISSKVWTVNFIDTLCSLSKCDGSKKSYLSVFVIYKSIGGFLGFGLVASMYSLFDTNVLVISMCVMSVLYGATAYRKIRRL